MESSEIHSPQIDLLVRAILSLTDEKETYDFLEDLCTIPEMRSMAQRLEVAMLLREGKTYLEIAGQTGASTATISRVNRSLMYGTNGYNRVLDTLAEQGNLSDP